MSEPTLQELQAEIQRLKSENNDLRASLNVMMDDIFKRALDRVSDSICMVSETGKLHYANEQFCNEYGVVKEYINGEVSYDTSGIRYSMSDLKRVRKKLSENDGSYIYTSKYINATNNDVCTHQVSTFIVNVANTNMIWFFMQDISDMVKSRDNYRELNYLMDSILDNLPVCVFVKDINDDFRYLYWNKAFATTSGIPASKAIGNTDFEIFPSWEDAEKFRKDDLELVRTHETANYHETYVSSDGVTRICQTMKTIVPREDRGPLLLGVTWDITNMQNIEQELVQERLRADQSDRLKSTFMANMSHEIRTPLNAIVGFSELLVEAEDDESRKMFSDIIRQNSGLLLQLINDILDLSKIEAGTLEYNKQPMDLSELFRTAQTTLANKTADGVKLVFDNPNPNVKVIISEDHKRLTQVVTNLINNAIKFTKQGHISIGFEIKDDCIECHVADTGQGIEPENLNKIFDRFVKLNSFAQGTGIGLAICKMIVNSIGGKIWVESQVGIGSTFKFTIPYQATQTVKEQMAATPQRHSDYGETPSRAYKILIAEDVDSNFLLLKAIIGKQYQLLWAKDGQEAVKMYRESLPDMVLMDVKMPNMDGIEATRLIRTYSKDVPIIALSAFAYESDKTRAIDAGVNEYLTKPLKRAKLQEVMDKYLK